MEVWRKDCSASENCKCFHNALLSGRQHGPYPAPSDISCVCCQSVWGQVCLRMGRTLYDKWGSKHASTVKRWKFREKMNFTGDNVISLYLSYNWQDVVCCYVVKGCWQSWYSDSLCFIAVCFTVELCRFRAMLLALNTCPEKISSLFLCSWNKQKGSDDSQGNKGGWGSWDVGQEGGREAGK